MPESNLPKSGPQAHSTVEACVSRSFCDATFRASERRLRAIDYLIDHIHVHEHSGPALPDCARCRDLHERAFSTEAHDG